MAQILSSRLRLVVISLTLLFLGGTQSGHAVVTLRGNVGTGVLFPLFPFIKLMIASNFNSAFASVNSLSPYFFQLLGGVMFGL